MAAFLQEVMANSEIWVARGINKNVYSVELDPSGFSLPVWSNEERVVEFLKNARLVGTKYEPHAVPLEILTNVWLSDKMMGISELQLNPDGKTPRVLAVSAEEFIAAQVPT